MMIVVMVAGGTCEFILMVLGWVEAEQKATKYIAV